MEDALRYEISEDAAVLYLVGDYTVDRFIELLDQALSDPAVRLPAPVLIDATRSTAHRPVSEVERLVHAVVARGPRIQRVAGVTGSEMHFGLGRMASTLADGAGLESSIFRSVRQAREYLRSA